jgi:hypothetical protein
LIGFNNRRYDHPIVEKVIEGYSVFELYRFSQKIINNEVNAISWSERIIDLYEICPKISRASLKEFGHRLKYPVLENLPFGFDEELDDAQWAKVKDYNNHDLRITALLWEHLKKEYDGRQRLKKFFPIKTEYGGVPRLAEKCILSKLEGSSIGYVNELHKANNLVLPEKFDKFYKECFDISPKEYLSGERPSFMNEKHTLKGCCLKFGMGGLHGDSRPGVYEDVYDYDVSSYYPSIILNCGLGNKRFRKIYRKIYNDRLELKRKSSNDSDVLKLVLNSLYGKFLDKYSSDKIYSPNLAYTICFLGQFYLVDLLSVLDEGQPIIVNTDGVVCTHEINKDIIEEWQKRTNFELNLTRYKKMIVKDVNSYYAVTDDGKTKRKKEFLESCWSHNVKAPIIQRAVVNELLEGIPIKSTIMDKSVEPYDFCFFSKAPFGKKLLLDGKVLSVPRIRYYVSERGHILERESEKVRARIIKMSKIKLLMELSTVTDINYCWYISQSEKLRDRIINK